jgi:hypothetical protein
MVKTTLLRDLNNPRLNRRPLFTKTLENRRKRRYLIFFGQFGVNPLYPIEKPVVGYSVGNG